MGSTSNPPQTCFGVNSDNNYTGAGTFIATQPCRPSQADLNKSAIKTGNRWVWKVGDMTKLKGNSHGFTMIELVMVITIMGILMVVVAPKFFETSDYTSRGFYEELMGAARYAQKFAVASGCQVQLNITANSYALKQRTACDTSSAFNLDVTHPSKAGNFVPDSPSPVTISPAPLSIVFDALGRASATVTISVGTRSFKINSQSGFVERL